MRDALEPEGLLEMLGVPTSWSDRIVVTGGSLAVAGWSTALDPLGLLNIAGILITLFPPLEGVARRVGIAPVKQAEQSWMYMYAFGKKPTRRRVRAASRALSGVLNP